MMEGKKMTDNTKPEYMSLSDHIHVMFEMFVQKRWLKELDRQLSAVNRSSREAREAKQRADHELFVLHKLIDEYNTRYHDGIFVKEADHAAD